MITVEQITKEIEAQFGFVPPFFAPALQTPDVLENLWQQTLSAYVNNPLPILFKEKLFAYLSRYCAVPYCIICHSCALRPLGVKAADVLKLLKDPAPATDTDFKEYIDVLASETEPLETWPKPDSPLTKGLFLFCVHIFLNPGTSIRYRKEVRRLLGAVKYARLTAFLSYIKTCHMWVEAHPELSYEANKRYKEHFKPMIETDPDLADFFQKYSELIESEHTKREVQLATEITELKRTEKELERAEKKWHFMLNSSMDGIIALDADSNIVVVSSGAEKMFGYRTEELIGQPFKRLVPEERTEEARNILNEVKEKGFINNYITQRVGKDGRLVDVDLTVTSLGELGTMGIFRDINERKRAEEKLRESEARYHLLVDTIPDAIVVHSDGKIVYANPSAAVIFSVVDAEKLIGQPIMNFVSIESRKIVMLRMRQVLEEGKTPPLISEKLLRLDGTLLDAEVTAVPTTYNGQPAIQVIIRDITERKRAEDMLKESEERLQAILDNTTAVVYLKDTKGRYIFINHQYEYLFHISKEEIVGKTDHEIFPKELADIFRANDLKLIEANGPIEFEEVAPHDDGPHTYISIKFPLHDASGSVYGVCGISTDITDRKRTEEALKESEARYKQLIDNIDLGITLMDKDYNVVMTNSFASKMLNKLSSELVGMYCYKEFEKRDEVCEHCPGTEAMTSGKPTEVETEGVLDDGTRISVHIKAFPVFGTDGQPTGFIDVVEDITDRKRMEAELLKVQKLESLGILAGGIAHDFNNLLTGIIGNVTLLEKDTTKDKDSYNKLIEVETAAMQAKELTQQLLTFSKGGKPIKETVSIALLIQEIITFALRGSNVKLEQSIPDNLWLADADRGQVAQCINNLAINAVQAMPTGGVLKVSAKNRTITRKDYLPIKDGKYVEISVMDKGIGIPEDSLAKVFDPYFTTKQKGSGLGLAGTYSIVTKHGGHIDVSSEVGVGTTFRIYLPASENGVIAKKEKKSEITASTGEKILVMDDEEIVRDVATAILTSMGYSVKTSADGNKAIKLYKESKESGKPFDAVIIDLTIPGGMGGKEAIESLLEYDPEAKVIVSSGYSNDPIMADFKKYGFSGVIAKPYRMTELISKVHQVITGKN